MAGVAWRAGKGPWDREGGAVSVVYCWFGGWMGAWMGGLVGVLVMKLGLVGWSGWRICEFHGIH